MRQKKLPNIKQIPEIELLYVCNDDFKKAVLGLREKFAIKVNEDGFVDPVEFVGFDEKLIGDHNLQERFYKDVKQLCDQIRLQKKQDREGC
jgi:hypothetical protein